MIRILAISLVSLLVLGMSPGSADLLEGEDRSRGEMVVISGNDRPDLVEQFDLIKDNVELVRGVAYAKDGDGNLVLPEEVEAETREILAEIEEEARDREKTILAKSSAKGCISCPHCGANGTPHPDVRCSDANHGTHPECLGCSDCKGMCSKCGKPPEDCPSYTCDVCSGTILECETCDHKPNCSNCGKEGPDCPTVQCPHSDGNYERMECEPCDHEVPCSACGEGFGGDCIGEVCADCGAQYLSCQSPHSCP